MDRHWAVLSFKGARKPTGATVLIQRRTCQARTAWSRERRSDQRGEPSKGSCNYLEEEEGMLSNRSIPRAIVIPVLAYPDVNQAAAWLCDAFGFSVRLRIGNHRVQLNVGPGAVTVREMRPAEVNAELGVGCSITVRVEDVDAHCNRARDR